MIEAFRFLHGRIFPSIKIAECLQCNPVHVSIHFFFPASQQCLHKIIVVRSSRHKPSAHHAVKHPRNFMICQCQIIKRLISFGQKLHTFIAKHLQIAACQQQAPDRRFIVVQLVVHDLFVDRAADRFPFQELLKCNLYPLVALTDQLAHKAVCTCICPVGVIFSCFKKIDCRPRIIDIRMASKYKSIIPPFYLFLFFRTPAFIQCCKHFLLGKSKGSCVFIGGCRYNL